MEELRGDFLNAGFKKKGNTYYKNVGAFKHVVLFVSVGDGSDPGLLLRIHAEVYADTLMQELCEGYVSFPLFSLEGFQIARHDVGDRNALADHDWRHPISILDSSEINRTAALVRGWLHGLYLPFFEVCSTRNGVERFLRLGHGLGSRIVSDGLLRVMKSRGPKWRWRTNAEENARRVGLDPGDYQSNSRLYRDQRGLPVYFEMDQVESVTAQRTDQLILVVNLSDGRILTLNSSQFLQEQFIDDFVKVEPGFHRALNQLPAAPFPTIRIFQHAQR